MYKSRRPLRTKLLYAFILALLPVMLLLTLSVEVFLVPYVEKQAITELSNATRVLANAVTAGANVAIKNHLRAIAEKDLDIARHFYLLSEKGVLTKAQAEEMLRGIFLSQKIGSSGYLYCLNSQGDIVLHPQKQLENTNVASFAFVKKQLKLKNGYIEYNWKNPGEKKERAKALYMVYFKPFDWIISVSSYREEFTQLLNPDDLRETVLSLKFGKSGYAYVINSDGETLIHPEITNLNILTSDIFPNEFAKTMIKNGSGYLEYEWQNPSQKRMHRKMAVYETIPEFDWIVVSSAYYNEVMQPVSIARIIAYSIIGFIMLSVLAMAYILSGILTRPVMSMIRKLDYNSRNKVNDPLPVEGSREIARLSNEFNNFIQMINIRNSELLKQQQRYSGLFKSSPDAVLLIRGINIVDCSPATYEIFECTREEILSKDLKSLSPPVQPDGQDTAKKGQAIIEKLSANEMITFEWQHITVKGRLFDADVRLSLFAEEEGQMMMVAFIRDITEQKKTYEQIRHERDFSKILIESSPAYILNVDESGVIHMANPSFCKSFGYTRKELYGKNAFDMIKTNADKAKMRLLMQELLRDSKTTPGTSKSGACTSLGKNDKELLVQWSATMIKPTEYNPASIIVVGIDISEERSLQEQLHHAQKLEALGRLAGGVAHDFNNMLGGIIGAAELIENRIAQDDPIRKYVDLISDTVEKASKLSRRLLAFSSKGKRLSTPINIHTVLKDAIRIFSTALDQDISVSTALDAIHTNTVGDPSQLQNVFLNLLLNSRDAMPNGGSITIATSNINLTPEYCEASSFSLDPDQYIQITVADTGMGIDDKILSKIFEPFFTTKTEGKGTGLGLASAYGAIRDHHGEISARSAKGQGTTFSIRIPCFDDVEVSPEGQKSAAVSGTGKILLVDDDQMLQTTGSLLLQELGYSVETASDGLEALEYYEEHQDEIDLVLLDMIMPRMDGNAAFEAIRQINPNARIIIASGFSDKQSVAKLERSGLIGFVHKPYRMAELSAAISNALSE